MLWSGTFSVHFKCDVNVVHLDGSGGRVTAYVFEISSNFTLKIMYMSVYKIYFNKLGEGRYLEFMPCPYYLPALTKDNLFNP